MKILLVEDNLHMALSIQDELKTLYCIDLAQTGEEALYLVDNYNYDLIILDIELPDIDGYRVCQLLRKKRLKSLILILTLKTGANERIAGFNAGADDYLSKPFGFMELKARIRALSRRLSGVYQHEVLKVGALSLDVACKKLKYMSKTVRLRRKEYLLLELLMRHQGQVVSQELIAEYIWNDLGQGDNNAIAVHIKNLRNKIDKRFGTQMIRTVRGFGYKLICAPSADGLESVV